MKQNIIFFIPETKHLDGKSIAEVKDKMEKQYISAGKYRFASIEEADTHDWPEKMYSSYFFFGSMFLHKVFKDSIPVPYVWTMYRRKTLWSRQGVAMAEGSLWSSDLNYVVLVEIR